MAISMAMVCLGPEPRLSVEAIAADLKKTWPSIGPVTDIEQKDATLGFNVAGQMVICGLMPAPIPWSDLEGPCATSWLWKDAAQVLKTHATHLIVTVAGEGRPLERIRLLTMVTAAIVATCPQTAGVFWTEAGLVLQPPLFREFATEMLPDSWPVHIWVDFRAGKGPDGKMMGFTHGMGSLGHMEFETQNSSESPGELRERLITLCGYVLEHGPVIRDGDTVGQDAREKIQVKYGPSSFGNDGQVMRLDYSTVSGSNGNKPWWKFW